MHVTSISFAVELNHDPIPGLKDQACLGIERHRREGGVHPQPVLALRRRANDSLL